MQQSHNERQDFETPPDLFNLITERYGPFDIDVCANNVNTKVPHKYYSPIQDALSQEWSGRCYMNPPYGHDIHKWVKKASEANAYVVCLLPSRTDTRWFHEYILKKAVSIIFLCGRPKFWLDGQPTYNMGKFPSFIAIFNGILPINEPPHVYSLDISAKLGVQSEVKEWITS